MDEVERIRQARDAMYAQAREHILSYLGSHMEGYSKELKRGLPDMNLQQVYILLDEMEQEGLLASRRQEPPHSGGHNQGGWSRRYFRKAL